MFEIGDIVKVDPSPDVRYMSGSPIANLLGSIAVIEDKTINKNVYSIYPCRYTIKFIEPHLKRPNEYDPDWCNKAWRDCHFTLIERPGEIKELDTECLFK